MDEHSVRHRSTKSGSARDVVENGALPRSLTQLMNEPGIIFDLDGTLIDSVGDISFSMNDTLRNLDCPELDVAEVRALVGRPVQELFRLGGITDEAKIDLAVVQFRDHLATHAGERSRPFPDVIQLLMALRDRGIRTGVATTKPTSLARIALDRAGLGTLMDHVQGSDGLAPKPAPDVVLRCQAALGVAAATMVGDTPDDIRAGQLARAGTIGVAHGTRPRRELLAAHPDAVVERIGLLVEWVM